MGNFKIKNRKVYRMSLTTLSPIFINSGEILNKTAYTYNADKGIVNIINNKKLISFLKEKGKFDFFLYECINGKFDLSNFFTSNNIINYMDLDIYLYKIKTYSDISEKLIINNEHHNISTFIKSENGCPYIPGSSIKGSIRTAIIYGEILNNKDKYSDIFENLLNKYQSSKDLRNTERTILYKSDILNKMFRYIQVSDTNDVDISNLYISQRHDVVAHKNEGHDLPIFMEVLKPGVTLYFNLTMDNHYSINNLLKYFNNIYNNENNNTFYNDYLSLSTLLQEKMVNKYPLFDDSLIKEKPNIFIGGANGFLTKSIIYAIRKKKNEDVKIKRESIVNYMKKYFDKKFVKYDKDLGTYVPSHDHVKIDEKISPRSLRLVKISQNDFMGLGMCNIKVEEELC